MLELERLQRRKEEEAAEKVRGTGKEVEVVATAETVCGPGEGSPVTRDQKDENLRMQNASKLAEIQRFETPVGSSFEH